MNKFKSVVIQKPKGDGNNKLKERSSEDKETFNKKNPLKRNLNGKIENKIN
jgi:hypothetical protein